MQPLGIVTALLVFAVGAVLLVAGFRLYRLLAPLWGFAAGFELTITAAQQWFNARLLSTLGGWLLAILVELIIGALAYASYYVSIVLLSGTIGFWLGQAIGAYFLVRPSVGMLVAGAVGGVALAAVAITLDLPRVLIIVLTSLAGAGVIILSALLATGAVSVAALQASDTANFVTSTARDSWLLTGLTLALAIVGAAIQFGKLRPAHYAHATMRRLRGIPLWPGPRSA